MGREAYEESEHPRYPRGTPLGGKWAEKPDAARVDSPEFKRWFGDSKVVDASGKPLVVYRGDRPNKTRFTGTEDPSNYLQGNIFFSSKPTIGRFYTPGYQTKYMVDPETLGEREGLYRAYLSLQRPLIVNAGGQEWSQVPLPKELADKYRSVDDAIQIDDLAIEARKLGYDGLIVRDVLDQAGDGDQFVAFSPTQIKSATANRGTFDPDDPDITAARKHDERKHPRYPKGHPQGGEWVRKAEIEEPAAQVLDQIAPEAAERIREIERRIIDEPLEHGVMVGMDGKVINEKVGTDHTVNYSAAEFTTLKAALSQRRKIGQGTQVVFTHNHPNGMTSLSVADLCFAAQFDVRAVRAVGRDLETNNFVTYTVERPKNGPWPNPLALEGYLNGDTASRIRGEFRTAKMGQDELRTKTLEHDFSHQITVAITSQFNLPLHREVSPAPPLPEARRAEMLLAAETELLGGPQPDGGYVLDGYGPLGLLRFMTDAELSAAYEEQEHPRYPVGHPRAGQWMEKPTGAQIMRGPGNEPTTLTSAPLPGEKQIGDFMRARNEQLDVEIGRINKHIEKYETRADLREHIGAERIDRQLRILKEDRTRLEDEQRQPVQPYWLPDDPGLIDTKILTSERMRGIYDEWVKAVKDGDPIHASSQRRKIIEEMRSPTLEDQELLDKGEEWESAAREEFGLTDDPLQAGYILSNGDMLDFSGGQGRGRTLDHRDIGAVSDDLPGGTKGMHYFMYATNAVRLNFFGDDVDAEVTGPLSHGQETVIAGVGKRFTWDAIERGADGEFHQGSAGGADAEDVDSAFEEIARFYRRDSNAAADYQEHQHPRNRRGQWTEKSAALKRQLELTRQKIRALKSYSTLDKHEQAKLGEYMEQYRKTKRALDSELNFKRAPEPTLGEQLKASGAAWEKRAIEHFGLTDDPREAGYILADGSMLDFSGKNEGGAPGRRAYDHREVYRATYGDGGTMGMLEFMYATGAVRMHYDSDGSLNFSVADYLTGKQENLITALTQPAPGDDLAAKEHFWDVLSIDSTTVAHGSGFGDSIDATLTRITRALDDAHEFGLTAAADWTEELHPRNPKGHPEGGRFAPKPGSGEALGFEQRSVVPEPRSVGWAFKPPVQGSLPGIAPDVAPPPTGFEQFPHGSIEPEKYPSFIYGDGPWTPRDKMDAALAPEQAARMRDFELTFIGEPIEHGAYVAPNGEVLLELEGDKESITVTKENKYDLMSRAARLGIDLDDVAFVHNHPNNRPLSYADLLMGMTENAREVRAVTSGIAVVGEDMSPARLTYSVTRPEGGWPDVDHAADVFSKLLAAGEMMAKEMFERAGLDDKPEEEVMRAVDIIDNQVQTQIMAIASEELGFTFRRSMEFDSAGYAQWWGKKKAA